jgi:hypothetical protein
MRSAAPGASSPGGLLFSREVGTLAGRGHSPRLGRGTHGSARSRQSRPRRMPRARPRCRPSRSRRPTDALQGVVILTSPKSSGVAMRSQPWPPAASLARARTAAAPSADGGGGALANAALPAVSRRNARARGGASAGLRRRRAPRRARVSLRVSMIRVAAAENLAVEEHPNEFFVVLGFAGLAAAHGRPAALHAGGKKPCSHQCAASPHS